MKKSSYLKIRRSHAAAVTASLVLGASFLLMKPVTQLPAAYERWLVPVLGLVFWFSLFGALGFIPRSNILGGRYKKSHPDMVLPRKRAFLSNPAAVFADLLLIIGLLAAVLLFLLSPENQYLYFFAMAALSLSICFHFIFNGNAYQVLRAKQGKRE